MYTLSLRSQIKHEIVTTSTYDRNTLKDNNRSELQQYDSASDHVPPNRLKELSKTAGIHAS
jgi:hypothetical protein